MQGQGPRWPLWGKMALAGWGPRAAPKQHRVPKQEDRGPVARGSLCMAAAKPTAHRATATVSGSRGRRAVLRPLVPHQPRGRGAWLCWQNMFGGEGGRSKLPNLPHKESLFRRKITDVIIIR